jgi:hypothetical protein
MISLNCIFKVAVLPQVAMYIKNLRGAGSAVLQAHNGAPAEIVHSDLDEGEVSPSMLALTILVEK